MILDITIQFVASDGNKCDRICENVHSSHNKNFWLFCTKMFVVMHTHYMVSFSAIRVLLKALLIKTCSIHCKINFQKVICYTFRIPLRRQITNRLLPFNAIKTRKSVQNYAEFAMLLNVCVIFYEMKKECFKRYLSLVYASDT